MTWRAHARDAVVRLVAERLSATGCTVELARLTRLSEPELDVLVALESRDAPEAVQTRMRLIA